MANSFKVGDVVQLKSGGPIMTVSSEAGNRGEVGCTWFDKDDPKSRDFPAETLALYREDEL